MSCSPLRARRSPAVAVGRDLGLMSLELQVGPEPVGQVAVVLDDQDAGHGASTGRSGRPAARAPRRAAPPRIAPRPPRAAPPGTRRRAPRPARAPPPARSRCPAPRGAGRCRTNGSQIRSRIAAGMPGPPSSTSIRASASCRPSAQDHGPTVAAVPHGVVEQVEQDLGERVGVHRRQHASRPARCGAAPPPCPRAARTARRSPGPAARAGGAPAAPACHPPLGAGELEHVLHQMSEPPGLLHDHAERLPPLVFPADPAQLERLGEEQNLGERGAELVRDAAGEVGAEPGQLLLPAKLPDSDHAEPAREREQQEQDREPAPGLDQGQPRGDGRRKRRPGREPASGIGGRGAGVLAAGERAGMPEQRYRPASAPRAQPARRSACPR